MRNKIIAATVLAGLAGGTATHAADLGNNTTVGGFVFADLSHISDQQNGTDIAPTGYGVDVKRFYLIIDHQFNSIWSADITTDAQYLNSTSTVKVTTPPPTGSTTSGSATALTAVSTSGGVTEVYIKKLYVAAKLNDAFAVKLGAASTPWGAYIEDLYGSRWLEKTTTDRLGFSTTSDWGINASGAAGENGLFSYSVSMLNGGGYKNPTRTEKVDFEGRVTVKPLSWLTVAAGYYDGYLGQVNATNNSFPTNSATRLDLALRVAAGPFRVGGEYFDAKNFRTASASTGVGNTSAASTVVGSSATTAPLTDEANGYMVWAAYDVAPQWTVLGRYDSVKFSKDIVPGLKDTYFNVALQYEPVKSIDVGLIYKNEKVDGGVLSISSGDAGGSFLVGGSGVAPTGLTTNGSFDEVGIYMQWKF